MKESPSLFASANTGFSGMKWNIMKKPGLLSTNIIIVLQCISVFIFIVFIFGIGTLCYLKGGYNKHSNERIVQSNGVGDGYFFWNEMKESFSLFTPALSGFSGMKQREMEENENFENREDTPNMNKWVVLLTMCVDRFKRGNENDMEHRRELYKTQILNWLEKTSLPIFVVESSNNGDFLKEIADKNERLNYYVFDANELKDSSVGEINSLKYVLEKMKENDKYKDSTHIMKVTGRYFLDDFENKANQLEQGKDLYLQPHRDTVYQNSEYFGIKKEIMGEFIDKFDMSILMEENLHKFSLNREYVVFEPFENSIARGGDNLVLPKL